MTDGKEKLFGTIPLQITEQAVEDMLVTALDSIYGGSNYFIHSYPTTVGEPKGKDIFESFAKHGQSLEIVLIDESQDGSGHLRAYLTTTNFLHGLQLAAKNGMALAVVTNEDPADSIEADCILQYALFGELVYG